MHTIQTHHIRSRRNAGLLAGVALGAVIALAGCGGGGGGAGDVVPPGPVIDMNPAIVGPGDGTTLTTAYVLPTEVPAGTNGGIDDYFAVAGFWEISGSVLKVDLTGKSKAKFGQLVYDSTANQWNVKVTANYEPLIATGTGGYASAGCATVSDLCAEFSRYANSSTALYGTFGNARYDDRQGALSIAAVHFGLKTPIAEMPGGTAFYTGVFEGVASEGTLLYAAAGTTTIDVVFAADLLPGLVTLHSEGTVGDTGSYILDGLAVIADNTYTGSVDATVTLSDAHAADATYTGGKLNGAFYGPGAVQTAGAVSTTSATTGYVFVGGYWATK